RTVEILKNLESFELSATESARSTQPETKMPKPRRVVPKGREGYLQIEMFQLGDEELRRKIESVDLNNLTPVEALNKIAEFKKIIEKE
ncbi:MAG: hypothetical protein B7Z63_06885, partial [Ignavibacteriae bacterium 37-53-5]